MDVLFVHGALVRDGGWWWRRAAALLEERTGIRSRALALPSCAESTGEGEPGLTADAVALREALDDSGPTVLVGHSYGGTVIAEAGLHPAVVGLLLISSYTPEPGLSQGAIMSGEPDPVRIGLLPDGSLQITGYDARSFADRFLQDGNDEDRAGAWQRVGAQAATAFSTPTTRAGWQGVDSTYLVCTEDRSTSVGLQRSHAERATRSVDVPTGHHPFLTRPDLVVVELEALVGR
ncbi:alpha/beta hydrolase [Rathayibacter rathayi]|uniref:Alpha/beta hydrolase n=1 Tax=Rathayibacter rathayi TaxID=33887 RepID=A0ABD6WBM3_RATRA|nr:alpha/beta hydrolase [Rathayibacter rathayi]AZZ48396.1 alpha/beta hydrolase [Rathayibacter rathayi]MWV74302.1 alpha/beta fold hydrolase [Rathayibacter rathayi NCPPB 2980 = VKM Ac-1601]PPF15956.1 alpha/beta hydrolase [Rathayibacter rathayi]PPF49295.1 alpha/beta hydrolase [Rathayibacter rathayi]PPF81808.1 alpha/beta hydrolase [Rathayibacter rathayi]